MCSRDVSCYFRSFREQNRVLVVEQMTQTSKTAQFIPRCSVVVIRRLMLSYTVKGVSGVCKQSVLYLKKPALMLMLGPNQTEPWSSYLSSGPCMNIQAAGECGLCVKSPSAMEASLVLTWTFTLHLPPHRGPPQNGTIFIWAFKGALYSFYHIY